MPRLQERKSSTNAGQSRRRVECKEHDSFSRDHPASALSALPVRFSTGNSKRPPFRAPVIILLALSRGCPDRVSTKLTSGRPAVRDGGDWTGSVRTLRLNDLHFLPVVRKLL